MMAMAMTWLRATVFAMATLIAGRAFAITKVACVGDSITVGARSSTPAKTYPAQLGVLLGAGYQVMNFGVGGTTLLHNGDSPYVNTAAYNSSGTFAPDIVLIMLGTNDTKPANWSKAAAFDGDYKALLAHYAALASHPKSFVVLPPPVFGPNPYAISPANMDSGVIPALKKIAADTGTPLIDVYTALRGSAADFPDNVHPGDAGNAKMAQTIYAALTASPDADGGGAGAGDGDGAAGEPRDAAAPEAPPVADGPSAAPDGATGSGGASGAAGGSSGSGGTVAGGKGGNGANGSGGGASPGAGASSSGGCSVAAGEAMPGSLTGLWLALFVVHRHRRRRRPR